MIFQFFTLWSFRVDCGIDPGKKMLGNDITPLPAGMDANHSIDAVIYNYTILI
jgi:hypothetical protein